MQVPEVNEARAFRSLFSARGKRKRRRKEIGSKGAAMLGLGTEASVEKPRRRGGKMFSHVSITQNADTARYLPYNSLAFPALASQSASSRTRAPGAILPNGGHFAQMAQEQYLKDVWLSAFLDHEERTEKERTLKELAHFLRLPHGQLMPEVARRLRETNAKFENVEKVGQDCAFSLQIVKASHSYFLSRTSSPWSSRQITPTSMSQYLHHHNRLVSTLSGLQTTSKIRKEALAKWAGALERYLSAAIVPSFIL